ncbi:hypothetical protein B0H16DRAFT_1252139, partial [Mycena metata]
IEIYNKDLPASIMRYHSRYDPLTDHNPLTSFGANDHVMPGKIVEETAVLRDMLLHLQTAHRKWFWDTLDQAVKALVQIKFTKYDLMVFGEKTKGVTVHYCLNHVNLEQFAHVCLAVHQVLEGLYEFMNKSGSARFPLDHEWKLLRLLKENLSRSTILMTCATLQMRLERAMRHVHIYLDSIRRVNTGQGLNTLSSVDSTRSSVRSDYGRDYPEYELAKLLSRPNY